MKILSIPPQYRLTKKIVENISAIESNRSVIDHIDLSSEVERNFRHQSILGSALFSARIEGNKLTRAEVQSFGDLSAKDQQKVEVANLGRTIEKVLEFSQEKKIITRNDILSWHRLSMKNIIYPDFLGKIRTGQEGIFDPAGNLVYHAPPPSQVHCLMDELLSYVNRDNEKLTLIKSILAHFTFEKIHPFVDGSGRIGRLLQMAILAMNGYSMKGLIVVEEEIETNRQTYYQALEDSSGKDASSFVELMLEFLKDATSKAKDLVLVQKKNPTRFDTLSPRRKEIALIVSEQRLISFNSIKRRFLKISPRQLAYDLEALVKEEFIIKVGKTRGALYAPRP